MVVSHNPHPDAKTGTSLDEEPEALPRKDRTFDINAIPWLEGLSSEEQTNVRILDELAFCGYYLNMHGGGRSGRAPILCMLRKHDNSMAQRDLSLHFELKPGSLSEVLSKAEEAGLIKRTRDAQDRRQLIVSLTEQGKAWADKEQQAREAFRTHAFSCLSADELAHLENMLNRITEHWRTMDD